MPKARAKKDADTVERMLGEEIRLQRKALHMSQERVAELSGLSRSYVSLVEAGKVNVTLATLESIAKVLGRQVVIRLTKRR